MQKFVFADEVDTTACRRELVRVDTLPMCDRLHPDTKQVYLCYELVRAARINGVDSNHVLFIVHEDDRDRYMQARAHHYCVVDSAYKLIKPDTWLEMAELSFQFSSPPVYYCDGEQMKSAAS